MTMRYAAATAIMLQCRELAFESQTVPVPDAGTMKLGCHRGNIHKETMT
jgi:hypothetical protein